MDKTALTSEIIHFGDQVMRKNAATRLLEKALKFKNNTLWASDLDFVLDGTEIFSEQNRGCYIITKEGKQPVGSLCMCNIKFWIEAEQNNRPGIDVDHMLPEMIWERYAKSDDVACLGDLLSIDGAKKQYISDLLLESMETYIEEHAYKTIYLHVHSDTGIDQQALTFWKERGYQLILERGGTIHFEKIV